MFEDLFPGVMTETLSVWDLFPGVMTSYVCGFIPWCYDRDTKCLGFIPWCYDHVCLRIYSLGVMTETLSAWDLFPRCYDLAYKKLNRCFVFLVMKSHCEFFCEFWKFRERKSEFNRK